jgi:hypothetical protein
LYNAAANVVTRLSCKSLFIDVLHLLQMRKHDWPAEVVDLRTKLSKTIVVAQAASVLQLKCLHLLEADQKLLKVALREILLSFMDIADACNSSVWRRSKPCESLFESLITGVAQIAAVHRSQLQRVFLRFKTVVLTACAQVSPCPVPCLHLLVKSVRRSHCLPLHLF